MSTTKTPRTDAIMVLVRKAFNAPNLKDGLRYLEQAHDAVEKLEKDGEALRTELERIMQAAANGAYCRRDHK